LAISYWLLVTTISKIVNRKPQTDFAETAPQNHPFFYSTHFGLNIKKWVFVFQIAIYQNFTIE